MNLAFGDVKHYNSFVVEVDQKLVKPAPGTGCCEADSYCFLHLEPSCSADLYCSRINLSY